jgi:flagellar biosynthesis component FlhA
MSGSLQPSAREKVTLVSTLLQKQIAALASPEDLIASARTELSRQFPGMTQAQQDQMVFLALTGAVESMDTQKDSMGELGSETSTRLQMYQDRRSKLMSTLSNMLKKMADTSGSIISNMK